MGVNPAPPLLDDEHVAFVQSAVSIVASSCDARLIQSIGRIAGCRVADDRRRVTIFVASSQAPQLLADVGAGGRIAVVFSLPSTNRSYQLKAGDANARALAAGELDVIRGYVAAFGAEIASLGHEAEHAQLLLSSGDTDMLAVDFTPNAAFEQTPGPHAGKPIPLGR
jgi:hypothetical protein